MRIARIERIVNGDSYAGCRMIQFKLVSIYWYLTIPQLLAVLWCISYHPDSFSVCYYIERFALTIFSNHENLKLLFNVAILIHYLESIVACYICLTHEGTSFGISLLWFLQTLLLGGVSLYPLYILALKARIKKDED